MIVASVMFTRFIKHQTVTRIVWCFFVMFTSRSLQAQHVTIRFAEVSNDLGIHFVHVSPFTPQRHLHLTMGSGLAWIDYDLDGASDLYLAQGTPWKGSRTPFSESSHDQLWRNQRGQFTKAKQIGLNNRAYGMGLAVGDYNNDGFPDLYISSFGLNVLYENNGDGTFSAVTDSPALLNNSYGASTTWIDVDADGDLDLFLTNYLDIKDENYTLCDASEGEQTIAIGCPPWRYPGAEDLFFENLGNGRFSEKTEGVGLKVKRPLAGLGVAAVDLDHDGLTDLFVANDSDVNQLWKNAGAGNFTEWGLVSGTAINRRGEREAGMGVAYADIDQDGLTDLFLTHYFEETNTLYRNLGGFFFLDVTDEMRLAGPSRPRLAFGTVLKDFNGDGYPDCFIANGHIHDQLHKISRKVPYAQLPQLFQNEKGKSFTDVTETSGDYFQNSHVGRGAASADFDQDGKIDLAIQHLNGPAALLKNETEISGKPLRIQLIGTQKARDPIGARVTMQTNQRTVHWTYQGSSSYLSSNERAITTWLRTEEEVKKITVTWPGGMQQEFSVTSPLQVQQLTTIFLVEGMKNSINTAFHH